MRIYLKIIILIILVLSGTVFYASKAEEIKLGATKALRELGWSTVCDETLHYSLGNIDPRFNISEEEIKAIISEAENVWESKLGKNVFQYREGAEFKVNFIFDERQLRTLEKDKLDEQLDNLEYDKNNLSQEYKNKYATYNKALAIYEKNIQDYKDQVSTFNKTVEKLNKSGEITKEKYEEMKDEENELAEMKEDLDDERDRLSGLADGINKLVKKENSIVNNYNNKIETYKDRFGEAVEFNQGEYNGLEIDIYQFHDNNDLKLVLAHELGHALGIGHVENSKSIMYYLMEDQDLDNISLTTEDFDAVKNICKME